MKKYLVCLACILLVGCKDVSITKITPEYNVSCETTETVNELVKSDVSIDVLDLVIEQYEGIEKDSDNAQVRLTEFRNRLDASDIYISYIGLQQTEGVVERCEMVAYYYADCANVHYTAKGTDISLIVNGEDCYLLDNQSKTSYGTKSKNVKYASSETILSMFNKDNGTYIGSVRHELDGVLLLCDLYYIDNVVYRLCYDNNNLIAVGAVTSTDESWKILTGLTVVKEMGIFEVPDDYISVKYEDYKKVNKSIDSKFALLLDN